MNYKFIKTVFMKMFDVKFNVNALHQFVFFQRGLQKFIAFSDTRRIVINRFKYKIDNITFNILNSGSYNKIARLIPLIK